MKLERNITKEEFGQRVYRRMIELGMWHSELARRAGLPRNNISTYINGGSFPNRQNLAKLATALEMDPDQLLPRNQTKVRGAPDGLTMRVLINNPQRAWLSINQEVSTSVAAQILALLFREPQ